MKTEQKNQTNASPDPHSSQMLATAIEALEDLKAVDLRVLDVSGLTSITDWMIIVSGTSTRHVKALADSVVRKAKQDGHAPLGVEGEKTAEWVLIDLGDVIVHVMLPAVREFYALEKLWSVGSTGTERID